MRSISVGFLMLLASFVSTAAVKEKAAVNKFAEQTVRNDSLFVNLNDVLVYKSLRDNAYVGQAPVSSSTLSGSKLESMNAENLKSLAVYVPNLYVPDYGSPLTSAVYIRGLGSRLNTSAVGYYVDNIPYLDKSAFDFEWQDIQWVEVLRGPQGTLYGKNAVGGLVHIHTWSPFDRQGTTFRLSYGSYNDLNVQLSHSRVLNPHLALSVSGNYNQLDGFEKNTYTNKHCGARQSAGVSTKLAYRSDNDWKADLNLHYDYVDQQGYAYAPYDETSHVVSYNDPASYNRQLLTAGLLLEKQSENLIFNSMTGYQWMKDNLCLDQDFTPASIFTLNQRQNLNALTQEFVLKSKDKQAWKWVNGLFGSFKNLRTNSPVCFKKDGVSMLEASINGNIPSTYNMTFDLTDDELKMPSRFTENDYSAALYHQSTYQIPSVDGLSVSAGLRLDYERVSLDYASSALMNTAYTMTRGMMSIGDNLAVHSLLNGNLASDFWHLIPKFSIEYAFNKQNKLYASVTRGFQAGGYNIQLFSDLLQKQLQADMSVQLKNSIAQQLQPYVNMGMPQSAINTIVSHIPTSAGVENVGKAIAYNPEYSWNYELGFHSEPVNGKLQMDGAVFYIDTKDRQIAQFSPDGYGRMMKNAAGSVSKGVELSVLAKPFSHLGLNASYGLTEATFTEYKDSVKTSTGYQEVDYSGNYVPMVPKHTLSAGADYSFDMKGKVLDKIQLAAQYHAAGPIYWTEANNMKQAFYGLTDAQISFFKQHVRLDCWIRNAFDTRYNTFYFESMGSAFAQQGRPMQIGFTTKWTF